MHKLSPKKFNVVTNHTGVDPKQKLGAKLGATVISRPGIFFAPTGELEARLGAKAGVHDDSETGIPGKAGGHSWGPR